MAHTTQPPTPLIRHPGKKRLPSKKARDKHCCVAHRTPFSWGEGGGKGSSIHPFFLQQQYYHIRHIVTWQWPEWNEMNSTCSNQCKRKEVQTLGSESAKKKKRRGRLFREFPLRKRKELCVLYAMLLTWFLGKKKAYQGYKEIAERWPKQQNLLGYLLMSSQSSARKTFQRRIKDILYPIYRENHVG